jgi:REP element-mobilizing transposase RayT
VYFVTWRCAKGVVLSEEERDIALAAMRHWDRKRWKVFAAVVMPDHVHALVQPLPKADGVWDLAELLHSVKSFSAHQIVKARKVQKDRRDAGPTSPDTGPTSPDTGPTSPDTGPTSPDTGPTSPSPSPSAIWQDERYDRWVRDEDEFAEKWQYIADNPIKEGLASTAGEYRWLYLLEERPD